MEPVRTVLMTAPDPEVAERVATALVEARLAACANLVPGVTSIYRWEGAVERAEEVLVVLKTTASRLPELMERVAELHPYDVPEILALPVEAGHAAYVRWVAEETTDAVAGDPPPAADDATSAAAGEESARG